MRARRIASLGAVLIALAATESALCASLPNTPTVTEPGFDGKIVNAADVHMETSPFSDPDPGDTHVCTDWEIWTVTPSERVWATLCITGIERVHTHLADGVFEGSHAGRRDLHADTDYRLRVRHRSSSLPEWSDRAERLFRTGPASAIFPLETEDVAASPPVEWLDAGGDIALPGGAAPASLRLGSASGDLLLELRGVSDGPLQVTNPPALPAHVDARVVIDAGGQPLAARVGAVDPRRTRRRRRHLHPGHIARRGQSARAVGLGERQHVLRRRIAVNARLLHARARDGRAVDRAPDRLRCGDRGDGLQASGQHRVRAGARPGGR